MGGGNKNLQRQVGISCWKFSKKAREGKSGEFGVRRTKYGMIKCCKYENGEG